MTGSHHHVQLPIHDDHDHDSDPEDRTAEDEAPNGVGSSRKLLLQVSLFASLGVFLFGYDQGVMSGIITGPYFKAYFHQPTRFELATMVAILEIGAFITSILAGRVGDIFGRRATILMGASLFTVGGVFQSWSNGFRMMVLGRVLAGNGVGFLSMAVPVYQSEISPAEHRGRLACIEFTLNIGRTLSSLADLSREVQWERLTPCWIDYFSSYLTSDLSWRFPLFIQCIIGLILAIGSFFIPESPRWLLDMDLDDEGMSVLADLHGDGNPENERAKEEFREIKENVFLEREMGERSYRSMWKRYRGRVLLAVSAQAFAQLNGINVISYYAPLVFESAGWIGRDAIFMTGINGIIYVLSTIPTWYLVDTLGRRVILLSGATAMAIALTLVGFFLYLDQSYTPVAVVTSVIVYNAAFGYSWGPIPWLYPPEILPNAFRVKGVSLSTASNWAFVGEATPILQEAIRWRLYPMHAGFCVLSFILVYFTYPETMGVPLEEMDELFGDQPLRPLLSSTSHHSLPGLDGAPLRRSISHPGFRRGQPHEHSSESEPPKLAHRPRRHERTLSGSASLPGKGGPGVEGVREWWKHGRQGSASQVSLNGSSTGGRASRPGTPGLGGTRRNYQSVRQDATTTSEDEDEESAIAR
ncbi:sugar porter family MFS transporter [Sporobolomyces salmoneus]|uniref:sugar porter family MFS transporter n=1 Tax=Sporobolomyces salmoneus TaxID=183962 RepID=UPI00318178C3